MKINLTDPDLQPSGRYLDVNKFEYALVQFYRLLSKKDKLALIGKMRKAVKDNEERMAFIAECEQRDREREEERNAIA